MAADTNQGHDLSHIRYEGKGDHSQAKAILVVSKWNDEVTGTMADGAVATLEAAGLSQILRYDVPGSYELPTAASFALKNHPDAAGVICIGCVIQGETRHFDFISEAVAHGVMNVSLEYKKPVIFGVLTPDTDQQAKDRAGGKYGNKGEEAAVALLEMLDLEESMKQ